MILGETQQFASPEEALEHHGVKGMRWGVRKSEETGSRDAARANTDTKREMAKTISTDGRITGVQTIGSPKKEKPASAESKVDLPPLGPEAAKKQARVDKFLQRADVMDTRISDLRAENKSLEGSKNPADFYKKYGNAETIKQFEKAKQTALKDAEASHKGKLTSKQKKAIYGTLAVGGLLAGGYLAGKYVEGSQSGALNSYKLLARQRLSGSKSPFNMNKELTGPMSVKDILNKVGKPVNPLYSTAGGQMNCRRCTYTHELRRRGFDVRATTSAVGWGQGESGVINAVTTGGDDFFHRMSMSEGVVRTGTSALAPGDTRTSPLKKILLDKLDVGGMGNDKFSSTISSSKKVLEELAKQPEGARGEVVFKFPGFGHSMAYEVVGGKAHIFDSQKGQLYNAATKMVESKWDGFHSAEITRLDNVDLDTKFLTRWAANTKKPKKSSGPSVIERARSLQERAREGLQERTGANSDYNVAWT